MSQGTFSHVASHLFSPWCYQYFLCIGRAICKHVFMHVHPHSLITPFVPQCRDFSRAVMERKSLSSLFLYVCAGGVCVWGGGWAGGVGGGE